MINHLAEELSGGQQKLLAIGRLLMAQPSLLLLDEPVAGVNPTLANKIFDRIIELKEERGIGYRRISHILTEKGYRSVRTNSILKNNYIHSIYKKGKIRESRIERSFDSKIDNINLLF